MSSALILAERELADTRAQLSSLRVAERQAMWKHQFAYAEKLRWQMDACERHLPRLALLVADLTVAEISGVVAA